MEEIIDKPVVNITTGDLADVDVRPDNDTLSVTIVNTIESDEPEEYRGIGIIEFKILKVSNLDFDEHVTSETIMLRKIPWHLMVKFTQFGQFKYLCAFIEANNEKSGWSCRTFVQIRLLSTKENYMVCKQFDHIYNRESLDWGYKDYISWQDLENPENGFLEDDSIVLVAYIKADPPRGVNWDSKYLTGFVGLKNQGATCYMNSLLQTLFFMRKFRLAIFNMQTDCDLNILALQRVFYDLQVSKNTVCTKQFTRSFGWEVQDSYRQHDVQEYLRFLLEVIESKMKGTMLEEIIPELIAGRTTSFVKCKCVNYTSRTDETFYDIQLNIKDKSNIYESFKEYIATEELVGDNKYQATGYGLQDAIKGVIFVQLPPVLYLHLMRYQYDPVTDTAIKCNDRFEFYDEINLDNFLNELEPTPADYKLHAVLVHSGEQSSGHYVVFIDPNADGNWFKFDDDLVFSCLKTDAIDNNFGGLSEFSNNNSTNAYMLVYIRKSEISTVLREIEESDLPAEMVNKINDLLVPPTLSISPDNVAV